MLVRKPLQESLFLLQSVIVDRSDFAKKLTTDPVKLWSQTAGGVEVHAKRIQAVLDIMGTPIVLMLDILLNFVTTKKHRMASMVFATRPCICSRATKRFALSR